MKQRPSGHIEAFDVGVQSLAAAFSAMQSAEECQALLADLTTPAELEALADRWRVVQLLADKLPYRVIYERTGVSVTTIGRVARFLEMGAGGYRIALSRTRSENAAPEATPE